VSLASNVCDVAQPYDFHLGSLAIGGSERDAVEVLARRAVADWRRVEDDEEDDDDKDAEQNADDDTDQLEAAIIDVERDERHHRERQQKAEDEAEQVRVIVDHWKKADQEQGDHETGKFDDLDVRTTNYIPVVDDLDEQACQDTEVRPSRSSL